MTGKVEIGDYVTIPIPTVKENSFRLETKERMLSNLYSGAEFDVTFLYVPKGKVIPVAPSVNGSFQGYVL